MIIASDMKNAFGSINRDDLLAASADLPEISVLVDMSLGAPTYLF